MESGCFIVSLWVEIYTSGGFFVVVVAMVLISCVPAIGIWSFFFFFWNSSSVPQRGVC
jgi:hypothetical protein